MKNKITRPVGRPTVYRNDFCELLIEHMSNGMSFESFAGHPKVRVARAQLYVWREKHKEFQDAFEKGQSGKEYYLEGIALQASLNPKTFPVNTGLLCFFLKNQIGWKDRVEHTGDVAKPITLNYKINE